MDERDAWNILADSNPSVLLTVSPYNLDFRRYHLIDSLVLWGSDPEPKPTIGENRLEHARLLESQPWTTMVGKYQAA